MIAYNQKGSKTQKKDKFSPYKERLFNLLDETVRPNRKGISAEMGMSLSTLNAGLAHKPPKFSSFNLPALLKVTGDFRILFWLCRICGFQCYRLPDPINIASIAQLLGDLLVVSSQLQRVASEAIYRPGQAQREELAKQVDWTIAMCVSLRAVLEEESKCKDVNM